MASQCVADQLTIVITTSAVQSNPSTWLIDSVIQSFSLARGLTKCRKILICDGMKIVDGRANWKCGRATQQAYDNYQLYIKNLQLLAEEGQGEWEHTTILPLPFRHGFAMGVLEGLKLVTTPYMMIVQHDRAFNKIVEIDTLLKDMKFHHLLWVNYVKDLLKSTGIANLQWDPKLEHNLPPPTTPGMPLTWLALNPNPQRELALSQQPHQQQDSKTAQLDPNAPEFASLRPAREQYFPILTPEEQAKAALEVSPQYLVKANEFTLNHLVAGYTPPFPIPYPQPSTNKPLMLEYQDPVDLVTKKYSSINSPFTPTTSTTSDTATTSSSSIALHSLKNTSSAIVCSHFLTRTIPDDLDSIKITQENSPISTSPALNHEHYRKPQYPHPLPIHYVNFVTNQTQQYLAHQQRDFHHPALGALPAYYTSQRLPAMLEDEQVQQELISPIFDYDAHSAALLSDTDSSSSSSSSSSSDNDSSSSSDEDDNNFANATIDTQKAQAQIQAATQNQDQTSSSNIDEFQTLQEVIDASNEHLKSCGIDMTSQNYHFAPRFLPMEYFYDSTHIALTQWYKELYLSEDIGGYPYLIPGCFHEDRYIQFQTALLNYGFSNETAQLQGNYEQMLQHLTPLQIRERMGISETGRPDSHTVQAANKLSLPLPIDPADEFSWTDEQRTIPFIYGVPPSHRVKDLQQTAFRIARCAKVQTFADAHNVILRNMGMWLYEASSISYSNLGEAIQDIKTHQLTCLKHRANTTQINQRLEKYRKLQQHNPAFKFRSDFIFPITKSGILKIHKRQMICGHLLTRVVVEKHGFQTAPQNGPNCNQLDETTLHNQETINNEHHVQVQQGQEVLTRRNQQDKLFNDAVIVWAVKGNDFLEGKTVQHLDGKAFLRYEQKIAKQKEIWPTEPTSK